MMREREGAIRDTRGSGCIYVDGRRLNFRPPTKIVRGSSQPSQPTHMKPRSSLAGTGGYLVAL